MTEFDSWQAHLDQLEAASREANRRAIRACIFQRWVCTTVIIVNFGVGIFVVIEGRIPWLSMIGVLVAAGLGWFNETLLRKTRGRMKRG